MDQRERASGIDWMALRAGHIRCGFRHLDQRAGTSVANVAIPPMSGDHDVSVGEGT